MEEISIYSNLKTCQDLFVPRPSPLTRFITFSPDDLSPFLRHDCTALRPGQPDTSLAHLAVGSMKKLVVEYTRDFRGRASALTYSFGRHVQLLRYCYRAYYSSMQIRTILMVIH